MKRGEKIIDYSNIENDVDYVNEHYGKLHRIKIAVLLYIKCGKELPCDYISRVFNHENCHAKSDKWKYSSQSIRGWLVKVGYKPRNVSVKGISAKGIKGKSTSNCTNLYSNQKLYNTPNFSPFFQSLEDVKSISS